MSPSRHGPNRLRNYLETHETVLAQLKDEGFVCHDDLELAFMPGTIRMWGEISCIGEIVIRVDKTLAIVEDDPRDPLVQTVDYSYNASVRRCSNFLRHDNAHAHPGHPDNHHRHVFDWRTGDPLSDPEWCGGDWPTLGDFIGFARDWYWAHWNDLPNPEQYAAIGLRDKADFDTLPAR